MGSIYPRKGKFRGTRGIAHGLTLNRKGGPGGLLFTDIFHLPAETERFFIDHFSGERPLPRLNYFAFKRPDLEIRPMAGCRYGTFRPGMCFQWTHIEFYRIIRKPAGIPTTRSLGIFCLHTFDLIGTFFKT